MGITRSLPRLVRFDVAKELVLTARMLDGAEAVRVGLATRLADDPLAAARELAAEIAARSPDATRRGKALLERGWTMAAGGVAGARGGAAAGAARLGEPDEGGAAPGFGGEPAEFDDPSLAPVVASPDVTPNAGATTTLPRMARENGLVGQLRVIAEAVEVLPEVRDHLVKLDEHVAEMSAEVTRMRKGVDALGEQVGDAQRIGVERPRHPLRRPARRHGRARSPLPRPARHPGADQSALAGVGRLGVRLRGS